MTEFRALKLGNDQSGTTILYRFLIYTSTYFFFLAIDLYVASKFQTEKKSRRDAQQQTVKSPIFFLIFFSAASLLKIK